MKKLKKMLFFAFIAYIGFTFFQQQVVLEKLDSRYRNLKNKEAAVIKENKYLNELLHQINSESFIENEARQKLGLVKKGEIIYVDVSKTKFQETKK